MSQARVFQTVKGVAIIDIRSTTGTLINRAGMFGVDAANDFTFPVDVTGNAVSNTVFAMANVNDKSALTATLQLMSENGHGSPFVTGVRGVRGVFAKSITLGARQPITAPLTDNCPQLAVGFRGKLLIRVSSGQPNSL